MTTNQSASRPLHGLVIGLSVSVSENIGAWGYTPDDVNRVTVRMSEALLAAGARLMFGHDWRPDGIMDALCRLAVKYQPAGDANSAEPLIQSLLPWPVQTSLDPTLRVELEQRGVLRIESMPAPAGDWPSNDDPTAKAVALSELRIALGERCDARICVGGKEAKKKDDVIGGFFAGVIEEAYRTATAGKPLYIGSFLGGASAAVVEYLRQQATQKDIQETLKSVFRVVPSKSKLFEHMQNRVSKLSEIATTKENVSFLNGVVAGASGLLEKATSELAATMVKSPSKTVADHPDNLEDVFINDELQERSGLSSDDWLQLLSAPDTESFVARVIPGLRHAAAIKARTGTTATPKTSPSPVPSETPNAADASSSEAKPSRKRAARKG